MGKVIAFGQNYSGQLGLGHTGHQKTPAVVEKLDVCDHNNSIILTPTATPISVLLGTVHSVVFVINLACHVFNFCFFNIYLPVKGYHHGSMRW